MGKGYFKFKDEFTPKRDLNYKDKTKASLTAGASYSKIEYEEFNPSSRDHLVRALISNGWKPTVLTETGIATLIPLVIA